MSPDAALQYMMILFASPVLAYHPIQNTQVLLLSCRRIMIKNWKFNQAEKGNEKCRTIPFRQLRAGVHLRHYWRGSKNDIRP